jgi:hypothetical protein
MGSRIRSDFEIGIEGEDPVPPGTMREIHWETDGLPILYTVSVMDFAGMSGEFVRVAKEHTRVLFER